MQSVSVRDTVKDGCMLFRIKKPHTDLFGKIKPVEVTIARVPVLDLLIHDH